jgi:hypothetical protein
MSRTMTRAEYGFWLGMGFCFGMAVLGVPMVLYLVVMP